MKTPEIERCAHCKRVTTHLPHRDKDGQGYCQAACYYRIGRLRGLHSDDDYSQREHDERCTRNIYPACECPMKT